MRASSADQRLVATSVPTCTAPATPTDAARSRCSCAQRQGAVGDLEVRVVVVHGDRERFGRGRVLDGAPAVGPRSEVVSRRPLDGLLGSGVGSCRHSATSTRGNNGSSGVTREPTCHSCARSMRCASTSPSAPSADHSVAAAFGTTGESSTASVPSPW